jgi:hypothetical protein
MKTEEHREEIYGKKAEIEMLEDPNRESHEYPCMLLRLFSREKPVKEIGLPTMKNDFCEVLSSGASGNQKG